VRDQFGLALTVERYRDVYRRFLSERAHENRSFQQPPPTMPILTRGS
jgi:hypothetical protein